jgi:hypothetical protein
VFTRSKFSVCTEMFISIISIDKCLKKKNHFVK